VKRGLIAQRAGAARRAPAALHTVKQAFRRNWLARRSSVVETDAITNHRTEIVPV